MLDIVKVNYTPTEYPFSHLPFSILDHYNDNETTELVQSFTGERKCDAKKTYYQKRNAKS